MKLVDQQSFGLHIGESFHHVLSDGFVQLFQNTVFQLAGFSVLHVGLLEFVDAFGEKVGDLIDNVHKHHPSPIR